MIPRSVVALSPLARHADAALLLLRVVVGAFLVWGVADNIASAERMHEFERFLARYRFAYPDFMARLSVWAQLFVGVAFVLGLLTRWAGLVCAINFVVAIAMVDRFAGIRGAFPSASLVAIGLLLATLGPGRYGLDARASRPARDVA